LEAFSLLEVNQYVRRVLALNFEEPFWVECEINSVSNSRGNIYLNLIEKAENSEEVVASNSAQIWYRQFLFIKKKLGGLEDSILQSGIKVKLKVNLSYSERYGLSLVVEDIDPAYTFGQFELNRQKTIEAIKKKGLMDKNAGQELPTLIKRIAVISSATAAGYQDFVRQLEDNSYGYTFDIQLFQAAMQGTKTETDVVNALTSAQKQKFDLITIIRGGGSKLDLSAFDNYNIAYGIAKSTSPVVTGIGHDIDLSVADMVAHTVLKTPTAVADWIVEHNSHFESNLIEIEHHLQLLISDRILIERDRLAEVSEALSRIPLLTLLQQNEKLARAKQDLDGLSQRAISEMDIKLNSAQNLITALSPDRVLARGYVMVRQGDKLRSSKADIQATPKSLELLFKDGTLKVNQE
jgi:exodeoxyribonuclease VII large subunit